MCSHPGPRRRPPGQPSHLAPRRRLDSIRPGESRPLRSVSTQLTNHRSTNGQVAAGWHGAHVHPGVCVPLREHFPTAIAAAASRQIDISQIISRIYDFEETGRAYEDGVTRQRTQVKNAAVP